MSMTTLKSRSHTRKLMALAIVSAFASSYAHADDGAKPAACDPYKDYSCLDSYLGTGFWERMGNYYKLEDGQAAAPADPKAPPSRRADYPPAAQTMPPMPFTEWPYGGTSPLGASTPNATDSPLMVALANTGLGKWMADNNIQTYGWIDIGGNVSNNHVRGGNAPAAYDYNPNAFDLNQIVEYIERVPDMVQKDHNDWGFRFSAIYGSDYRYTTSYGLGSYQLLGRNNANGWDMPMLYVDWYTPFVGEGLNIRVGRYISVPDIEAQLAPNNYMYSHSMTYTYDNYTNEGIIASYALNKNWILQAGVEAGTEATFNHLYQTVPNNNPNALYPGTTFKRDPGARPAGTLCARYNSDDGRTDLNVCANGINNGEWGYNNLQWYGLTFYHAFDEHWHLSYEIYQEHQNHVPNLNNAYVQGIVAAGSGTPFSPDVMPFNAPNMAWCSGNTTDSSSPNLTCRAKATGTTAYLNYSPNPLDNFSIRPEIYRDSQGQRTGTPTTYKNFALGWQHWFSPQIEVRPEIAYYHADLPAFNGNANLGIAPNHTSATIISGDVIFHW
ncbi:MAG: outer membrane beta-barrel protein [Burkholderiaceae bacterium]|nr:outer membrane beta-barrel protein [Burkholderiaceae bacterium]